MSREGCRSSSGAAATTAQRFSIARWTGWRPWTATGVLLALLRLLARDAQAVVALTPSDHAIVNPPAFRAGLLSGVRYAERRRAGIVLFGAEPDRFDETYGWIRPGRTSDAAGFRRVEAFIEKPGPERGAELLKSGAVWKTMVLVATGRSLLQLFASRQPALTRAILNAWRAPVRSRGDAPGKTYAQLNDLDFSRDVLTGATGLTLYTWPSSMGWSDLGTPDRLRAWIADTPTPSRTATSAA